LSVTCGRSVFISLVTPISSINKTHLHDIAEILLKVALIDIILNLTITLYVHLLLTISGRVSAPNATIIMHVSLIQILRHTDDEKKQAFAIWDNDDNGLIDKGEVLIIIKLHMITGTAYSFPEHMSSPRFK
jgi:hypothetical protein